MIRTIKIQPLSAQAFAPFGDVMQAAGDPDKIINQGKCGRYHDCAKMEFAGGKAGISIFKSEARHLPLSLDMVERHPEGSQAFVPMSADPFLVVVATNDQGTPTNPQAFVTEPGQAINFHRGTWHGVLTPLTNPGVFAVIDRIGEGTNLEEHWFTEPFIIEN